MQDHPTEYRVSLLDIVAPGVIMPPPDRRQALTALAAGTALAGTNPIIRAASLRQSDRIRAENEHPGTSDWQLTYVKFDRSQLRSDECCGR